MKKRMLAYSLAIWGLASQMVQAQSNIYITSFHGNGMLTWSNVVPNATCDVEWASSPEGPWTNSWEALKGIPVGTNTEMSASVPLFFRVAMTLPPPEPPSSFEIKHCYLQWPLEILGSEGSLHPVWGRVYAEGLTDFSRGPDPSSNLVAEVGYGPDGSQPETAGWTWFPCKPNEEFDDMWEDEYEAILVAPPAGSYDFACRFSDDGGETWHYADTRPDGYYNPGDAGQMVVEEDQ